MIDLFEDLDVPSLLLGISIGLIFGAMMIGLAGL